MKLSKLIREERRTHEAPRACWREEPMKLLRLPGEEKRTHEAPQALWRGEENP